MQDICLLCRICSYTVILACTAVSTNSILTNLIFNISISLTLKSGGFSWCEHLHKTLNSVFFCSWRAQSVIFVLFDKYNHEQWFVWEAVRREVEEAKCELRCMYNRKQRAYQRESLSLTHTHSITILLTWQASHIHFLQVFGLEDDHGQLARSGNVPQGEADIAQLLLLLNKQRRCRGEHTFSKTQIYCITWSQPMP